MQVNVNIFRAENMDRIEVSRDWVTQPLLCYAFCFGFQKAQITAVIGIASTKPSVPASSRTISADTTPMLRSCTGGDLKKSKSGATIVTTSNNSTPRYAKTNVFTIVPRISVPTLRPEAMSRHVGMFGFALRISSMLDATSIAPSTATPNTPINMPAKRI